MTTRAAILALTLALGGSPAFAASADADTGRIAVRTADLDLASARGRTQLDARLKSAARQLCRTGLRSVVDRAIEAQCIAETVAGAQPQAANAVAQAARGEAQMALMMVALSPRA